MIHLTSRLVAAYVGNNDVAADAVPDLIHSIYTALTNALFPTSVQPERQQPAVPIKKSITPDAIICLNCGKSMKMLKRHLVTDHGLSIADYRAHWNLASDYPSVAPNYSASRSAMALKIGLGRKAKPKRSRKTKAS